MADLTDHNMERLSHLFASGNMGHAREIARLLNLERTTERCTKAYPRSGLLEEFLHGLARSQLAMGGRPREEQFSVASKHSREAERPRLHQTLVGVLLYRAKNCEIRTVRIFYTQEAVFNAQSGSALEGVDAPVWLLRR